MSDEEATKAEEPKVEEPKAEKPKAEEPKAEEPKAEEPKAGGAKAEGAKAEGAKESSGGDKEGGRADKRSHSRSPDRRRRDRSRDRRERDRDRGRDRDRDRRDRDRDRDRGRDRTRRDSRSRSRSRDRSRRKKSRRSESESPKKSSKRSSNWDKPAPGMDANAAAAASVAAASASSVPQGFFGAAGAMNPMLNPLAGINPMLAQMMANMPGAASANPMILAQLLAQQAAAAAAGGANSVAAQQLSRKSRELYVGNIPLGTVNNQGLKEFFDTACEAAFGTDPQGFKPVVKAEINANGTFAFVEFRTPEIATQAMQLSGINMMGRELRLARPSGYVPPVGGDPSMSMNAGAGVASVLNANAAGAAGVAGLLGGGVGAAAGQDVKARKLYIGNLPLDLNVTEQTMMDFFNTAMLAAFPELKNTPGNPVEQVWMSGEKKFCFVTFRNEDEAMKGMQLDNIQLMGRPLRIGRPSDYVPPAGQAAPQPLSATGTNNVPLGSSAAAPAAAGADAPTSVVLRLTNTMTEAEVDDEEEYNDIKEDMLEECGKFGKVEALEMPKEGPGKTMVYIKFDSLESASNGFKMLHGRSFETRVVEASYYPEDKFDASDFS